MTEIVNKFLYAGDRLPKMPLKQPESIYRACISFNKNNEEIQNFMEAGYTCYIYQNKQDKFASNMILLMIVTNAWPKE